MVSPWCESMQNTQRLDDTPHVWVAVTIDANENLLGSDRHCDSALTLSNLHRDDEDPERAPVNVGCVSIPNVGQLPCREVRGEAD